ncbi:tetratricopeptide repeat protein [Kosmotoga pacifica]|uniref:tetratricopeptide repeat protein n=1 Tax=Kosmotoga pacifica TaxID=1330330 RepID=UPI00069A8135|nr:tetratricopeptide repeat protein [Kosmotoga pacifica]
MSKHEVLVYLPLKPSAAKIQNLPVKLPVRIEDLPKIVNEDRIDLDIIIRGLETQHRVKADEYYDSYLVYFYYEAFKKALNESDVSKAKEWLEKARKIKVDYRYFFYNGLLQRELGRLDLSEIELRKAVEMNNNFYVGYYELARLMQKKGEYDEAVKFHIKSLETSGGEFSLPLLGVIDAYIASGMIDSALSLLEHLPEDFPLFVDAMLRKGVLLNELQRYAEAEMTFNVAIAKEERWELFYNRAYSRERLGKLQGALFDLKKTLELNSSKSIYYDIALIERELGFVEDAIDHLLDYLEAEKEPAAELALARCYLLLGDFENAMRSLPDSARKDFREQLLVYRELAEDRGENEPIETPLFAGIVRMYRNGELVKNILELQTRSLKLPGIKELFYSEDLDYEELMRWLLKRFENEQSLRDRINNIIHGKMPKERDISIEEIMTFIRLLPFFGVRFDRLDLFTRRFAFILSGHGETLAILSIILKLYYYSLSGTDFDCILFLEEAMEEHKVYAFKFSKFIAENLETNLIDADTALEISPKTPREFLVKLLALLRADAIEEAIENDQIFYYFRR